MDYIEFLKAFRTEGTVLAVAAGRFDNTQYFDEIPDNARGATNVFFGPVQRKPPGGDEKEDCLNTRAIWLDCDDPSPPYVSFPPTITVMSGNGWHLYWFLDEVLEDADEIEAICKLVIKDCPTGDKGTWNVNRVMRVPETVNRKRGLSDTECRIHSTRTGVTYSVEEMRLLKKINSSLRHKISTGDVRGMGSRSERDWDIIVRLLSIGASEELIHKIFDHQPCGDKHLEKEGYLDHTIERAKASSLKQSLAELSPTVTGGVNLLEQDNCYYAPARGRQAARQLSTFVLEPSLLLDGSYYEADDALLVTVKSDEFTWPDIAFSRKAFTGVSKFDREAPAAAWQWIGSDNDIRKLLPHLMNKLKEKGLPKVMATPTMGLHKVKDKWFFVGDGQTVGTEQIWEGYEGPIVWLQSRKEHAKTQYTEGATKEALEGTKKVFELNVPEAMCPMVGWYTAAIAKVWFEEETRYRFPILAVTGTKGSGKTTLIQRVMLPLFGHVNPISFDAGTTRFITLSLLGSTNGHPVAFSEFRVDAVAQFVRFVLLAYDSGHDARGRPDQTTVDYPLCAPFSLDGEDLIADAAARERIVVIHLSPKTITEGGDAETAYNNFFDAGVPDVGGHLVQTVLRLLENGNAKKVLEDAEEDIAKAFPGRLPVRVRNNHIVSLWGLHVFCDVIGLPRFNGDVMRGSVGSIFNLKTGTVRTLCDDFIEDVVNACKIGNDRFHWSSEGSRYCFQLASAHTWWVRQRHLAGKSVLERDAIRIQLREADYFLGTANDDGTLVYEVDLKKATEIGLEVPEQLNSLRITFAKGE